MDTEEKQQNSYSPSISYGNKVLEYKDIPLTVTSALAEPFKCKHCSEEITFEQIKHILGEKEAEKKKAFIDDCLIYINRYRKNFGLDTCLRKAHFIAHVGAETGFRATTEGTNYDLNKYFTKYFKKQAIDDIIINSLKSQFTKIFKVIDINGKVVVKTNAELAELVKDSIVETKYLYGRYNLKEENDLGKKVEKDTLIKEIKEKKTENGKEIEVVKYKIYITKHDHFGIELLSRAYARGSITEISREGYKFRGRGIKQLTWKSNYLRFTNYRNGLIDKNTPFEKGDQKIDFTKDTDVAKLEGNYDKLGDLTNKKYGVQAAIWFFNRGNKAKTKYTIGWADEDNIKYTSYTINGGYYGLENRIDYTLKAKETFKVYDHYKEAHKNGNDLEKQAIENKLQEISKDIYQKVGNQTYNLKDIKAGRLYDLLKKPVLKLESISLKMIPLEIIANNIKISATKVQKKKI